VGNAEFKVMDALQMTYPVRTLTSPTHDAPKEAGRGGWLAD